MKTLLFLGDLTLCLPLIEGRLSLVFQIPKREGRGKIKGKAAIFRVRRWLGNFASHMLPIVSRPLDELNSKVQREWLLGAMRV